MRFLLLLVFSLGLQSLLAQPGPFGGFIWKVRVLDPETNTLITPKNKNYKIYARFYTLKEEVEIQTLLPFNDSEKCFEYEVSGSPVGAIIPRNFHLIVYHNHDSMVIFRALKSRNDSFVYRNGLFVNHENLGRVRTLKSSSGSLLRTSISSYALDSLTQLPFYTIDNENSLGMKASGSFGGLFTLPNGSVYVFDFTSHRQLPGNQLKSIHSGSYSPYTNQTTEVNFGLMYHSLENPDIVQHHYNYEYIDTFLQQVETDFKLNDSGIDSLIPKQLDWNSKGFTTFALLSQCLQLNSGTYIMRTLGKDNNRIYTSKDGFYWKLIKQIEGKAELNLSYDSNLNLIVALNGDEIHYSYDQGKSWSVMTIPLSNEASINQIEFINAKEALVMVEQRNSASLYRVDFIKKAYDTLLSGFDNAGKSRYFKVQEDILLVDNKRWIISGPAYLIVSENQGQTWEIIGNSCISIDVGDTAFFYGQGKRVQVPIHDNRPNYIPALCTSEWHILNFFQQPNKPPKIIFLSVSQRGRFLAPFSLHLHPNAKK